MPNKSFLNLENSKRGYNEVMLVKKENTNYNPNLQESQENAKHIEVKDRQGNNDEFHKAFQKSMLNKNMLMTYRISWVVAMIPG